MLLFNHARKLGTHIIYRIKCPGLYYQLKGDYVGKVGVWNAPVFTSSLPDYIYYTHIRTEHIVENTSHLKTQH